MTHPTNWVQWLLSMHRHRVIHGLFFDDDCRSKDGIPGCSVDNPYCAIHWLASTTCMAQSHEPEPHGFNIWLHVCLELQPTHHMVHFSSFSCTYNTHQHTTYRPYAHGCVWKRLVSPQICPQSRRDKDKPWSTFRNHWIWDELGVDKPTSVGFFWDCLVCFDLLLRDPRTQFWQSCENALNLHGKETGSPLVGVKNHGFLPFLPWVSSLRFFVG